MKQVKMIEAEQIGFEELGEDLVSVNMADQKFVIDMDTLYDLAFRCAAFLAYIENREEEDGGQKASASDSDCKNCSLLH